MIAALTAGLGADRMGDWGWRIPFATGGLLALIAIPVRLRAEATPIFRAEAEQGLRTLADLDPREVAPSMPTTRAALTRRLAFTFCLAEMQSAVVYTYTSYFPSFVAKYTTNHGQPVSAGAALFSTRWPAWWSSRSCSSPATCRTGSGASRA